MARIIYKHFKSETGAHNCAIKMNRAGFNAAYTDARYLSGRRTGYDVYAVTRRSYKGFKTKRRQMVYI